MIRYTPLAPISIFIFLAGCATAPDKATVEKERQKYSSRKLAVYCFARDSNAEDLAEAQIVGLLKKKGLDAYAKRALLPDPQNQRMHEVLKENGVGYVLNFQCMGTEQLTTGLPKGCDLPSIDPVFYPDDNGLVLSPLPQIMKVVREISGERLPR